MSEKFSPALRIGDLNDFIAPSQACIVSLKGLKKPDNKKPDKVEVSIADRQVKSEPVKISLKDCLACRLSLFRIFVSLLLVPGIVSLLLRRVRNTCSLNLLE